MTDKKLAPMLAETCEDTGKLKYPVLASPKLDGIRCLIRDGVALSRKLKPIPNQHVQEWAATLHEVLQGWDGELVVGDHDATVFNRTTSAIMSVDGSADFTFWVFDKWTDRLLPYTHRFKPVKEMHFHGTLPFKVRVVPMKKCENEQSLLDFEKACLSMGYEGVMVRDPEGYYKYGRSTVKEGLLLKVKRFKDDEAVIVGFEERMHNENEAKQDALGHTERSTHKAGMKPAGDLGALVVVLPKHALEGDQYRFNIGSGFTAEQRVDFWRQRDTLLGKTVKFKHFEQGAVDKPRFPIFLGFRDERDM